MKPKTNLNFRHINKKKIIVMNNANSTDSNT